MARCDVPRRQCYYHHCYGHLREPKPSGDDSARCFCPAHPDTERSLSFSVGEKARVIWHCFAGCDDLAVRAALVRDGISPDCLPIPKRDTEELVDRITGLYAVGLTHAELRWRVWSLVQGFKGEMPSRDGYPGGRRGFCRDAGVGYRQTYGCPDR